MFIIGSFFLFIFIILTLHSSWVYIVFIVLLNYILNKKFKKWLLILLNVSMLLFITLKMPQSIQLPETIVGKVILVKENYYILKTDYGNVKVMCDKINVENGNKLTVKINQKQFSKPTNVNGFNNKMYNYSQKVFLQAKEIEIVNNNHRLNLVGHAQRLIQKLKNPKLISYTQQLLLGMTNDDMEDIYQLSQTLSILHLFALSGMHLSILNKFLYKIGLKDQRIILLILGIYTFSLRHLVSIVRAYLILLLRYIFKERFNALELLSLVGIFLILNNPYVIYSLSFIFSFTVYGFMILTSKFKYANIYPFLASIPIILSTNYSLSLLSVLYVWIFSPVVEVLYTIILVNCLCLNLLSPVLLFILNQFENVLTLLSYTHIELIFKKPSLLFIVGYYFILLLIIYNEQLQLKTLKYKISLFILMGILYFNPYYTIYNEVTMIDVGQGDCILIRLAFNQGNYLIDTGGQKDYDVAKSTIIPYLKSIGIKKIDGVIITHDDFDHNGALESLIDNFKVDQVIKKGEDLNVLKYLDIDFYSDKTNDQSLVYYMKLNGKGYLFTGDLSSEGEKKIIEKYPNLKIDFLKVGHHGSLTSTSTDLLSKYKPKVGLIGVGKYNFYNHPNPTIIDRLKAYGVQTYRTDQNGMIRIYSFLNFCTIMVVDNSN